MLEGHLAAAIGNEGRANATIDTAAAFTDSHAANPIPMRPLAHLSGGRTDDISVGICLSISQSFGLKQCSQNVGGQIGTSAGKHHVSE